MSRTEKMLTQKTGFKTVLSLLLVMMTVVIVAFMSTPAQAAVNPDVVTGKYDPNTDDWDSLAARSGGSWHEVTLSGTGEANAQNWYNNLQNSSHKFIKINLTSDLDARWVANGANADGYYMNITGNKTVWINFSNNAQIHKRKNETSMSANNDIRAAIVVDAGSTLLMSGTGVNEVADGDFRNGRGHDSGTSATGSAPNSGAVSSWYYQNNPNDTRSATMSALENHGTLYINMTGLAIQTYVHSEFDATGLGGRNTRVVANGVLQSANSKTYLMNGEIRVYGVSGQRRGSYAYSETKGINNGSVYMLGGLINSYARTNNVSGTDSNFTAYPRGLDNVSECYIGGGTINSLHLASYGTPAGSNGNVYGIYSTNPPTITGGVITATGVRCNAQLIGTNNFYTEYNQAINTGSATSGDTRTITLNNATRDRKVRIFYRIKDYNGNVQYVTQFPAEQQFFADRFNTVVSFNGVTNGTGHSAAEPIYSSALSYNAYSGYRNTNYYDNVKVSYINQGAAGTEPINHATAAGTTLNQGSTYAPGANTKTYIYVDVQEKKPVNISLSTTTTAFTYMARALTPADIGITFKDTNASNADVSSRFNISGSDTAKIPVTYSYVGTQANGSNVSGNGLPSNAGTYTITVNVPADNVYSNTINPATPSGQNINGFTGNFTLTIGKVTPNVALKGTGTDNATYTMTYGDNLQSTVGSGNPFATASYTKEATPNVDIPGTSTWKNSSDTTLNAASDYQIDAGTHNHTITFTPTDTNNFNSVVKNVTLVVNKRALTITAAPVSKVFSSTPEYDNRIPIYKETGMAVSIGSNVASFDTTASAGWPSYMNYAMDINGNGDYGETSSEFTDTPGMGRLEWWRYDTNVGAYSYNAAPSDTALCASGTAVSSNYEISCTPGIFTVTPKEIKATAVAQDRSYIPGNLNVVVNITITEGLHENHQLMYSVAPVSGTMLTDSVGDDKPVTLEAGLVPVVRIPTSDFVTYPDGFEPSSNYVLTLENITNKDSLTVNIGKIDPIAVSPGNITLTYANETLAAVIFPNPDGNTPGTWTLANPETGTTVLNAGTYNGISLKFIPDHPENYNEATGTANITVNKAVLTVTSSSSKLNDTAVYGDTGITYSVSIDGFVTGQNANNVTETGSGNAYALNTVFNAASAFTNTSSPGNYPITISTRSGVANPPVTQNYSFNVVPGTLTVGKKALTITLPSLSWTYGAALNTNLFADYTNVSGFVNGDTISVLGVPAGGIVFETNYTPTTNAGSTCYFKVENGHTSDNYEITYVDGSITIGKAASVITVTTPAPIKYGDPSPSFTYTASSVNGEDITAYLDTNIALATTYVQWDSEHGNVGTYPISVSNLAALEHPNYTFTQAAAVLTVGKADITIVNWPIAFVYYSETLADAKFETAGSATGSTQSGINAISGDWYFADGAIIPSFYTLEEHVFYFVPHNQNYQTVINYNMPIEVRAKPISGIPAIDGSLMVGQTLIADTSAMDPANLFRYTITWYSVDGLGNRAIVETGTSFVIPEALVGYSLMIKAVVGLPYTGFAESAVTDVIIESRTRPEPGLFTYDASEWTKVYDGQGAPTTVNFAVNDNPDPSLLPAVNPSGITKYDLDDLGRAVIKYNNSTTPPTAVGRYRVTIDLPSTPNYGPRNAMYLGDYVITPRDYVVKLLPNDKVYDGTIQATLNGTVDILDGAVPGDEGNVNFIPANLSIAFASADASSEEIQAVITGGMLFGSASENYRLVLSDDCKAFIYKKGIDVSPYAASRSYIPGDNTITVSFNLTDSSQLIFSDIGDGKFAIPSVTATLDEENAGTRQITSIPTPVIEGSRAHNYIINPFISDLTVEILKAYKENVTDPIAGSFIYNGQTLDANSEYTLTGEWEWQNPNDVPVVSVSAYSAIIPGDSNYHDMTCMVNLTVLPAPLTVTLDLAGTTNTLTYGDPAPEAKDFDVTFSGFVGKDAGLDADEVLLGSYSIVSEYYQGCDVTVNGTPYVAYLNSTLYGINYDISYVNCEINVVPKTLTTTLTATDRVYSPGVTAVSLVASELEGKLNRYESVYLANYTPVAYIATPDAGENRTVFYDENALVLIGDKSENYTLAPIVAPTVTIYKANPTGYTFPTSAALEYGEALFVENVDSWGGNPSNLDNFRFVTTTPPSAVGYYPNTYEMIYTPDDANNYNTVTRIIPITVTVCDLNGILGVTISGNLTVGESATASLTGAVNAEIRNGVQYKWIRLANPNDTAGTVVAETATYTFTEADAGHYFRVEVSINGNYIGSANVRSLDPISQIILNFWQKLIAWINSIFQAIRALGGG